jgi:hypothetical protein
VSPLRAFVIMPFDSEFDAVYTELIVAPLTKAGFLVKRADDVEARRNVMVDVVRGIAEADLIVADLTSLNANVFYELGLAHAMGVPTVLIAQQESAEDIPFDLRQYRTEFYDTHFQRAKTIVDVLEKLGRSHAAGTLEIGSPVSDFLPSATKLAVHTQRTGAVGTGSPAVRQADDDATGGDEPDDHSHEPTEELGLLDHLETVSNGSDELARVAHDIVEATELVGTKVDALTQRLDALDQGSPTAATHGKRLLLQAAQILDHYAKELETKQSDFEGAVDSITSSGLGYLTLLSETPQEFRNDLEDALETSNELRNTVASASRELSGFREVIATLPPLLKQTNRARNRTVRALDALLAQFERVRSYAEQSIGLAQAGLDKAPLDPSVESGDTDT